MLRNLKTLKNLFFPEVPSYQSSCWRHLLCLRKERQGGKWTFPGIWISLELMAPLFLLLKGFTSLLKELLPGHTCYLFFWEIRGKNPMWEALGRRKPWRGMDPKPWWVNVSSAVCATEGCALLENLGVLQWRKSTKNASHHILQGHKWTSLP